VISKTPHLTLSCMKKIIIYNCFLGTDLEDLSEVLPRFSYVCKQLGFLHQLVISSCRNNDAKVVVVGTFPTCLTDALESVCVGFGFSLDYNYISRVNVFEFIGFKALHRYASNLNTDDLIFYCHSKGVVNKGAKERGMGIYKLHLIANLFADVDSVFAVPNILKAGLFPSRFGWLWHNFFWVRTSYMAGKSIEVSSRRHHYEDLIGDHKNPQAFKACFSTLPPVVSFFIGAQKDFFESLDINGNFGLIRLYDELKNSKAVRVDLIELTKLIDSIA
jgi:hypothetical protein